MPQSANLTLEVDAILFDMDGTLIDSTPVADLTYTQFVQRHGLESTGHLHVSFSLLSIDLWSLWAAWLGGGGGSLMVVRRVEELWQVVLGGRMG